MQNESDNIKALRIPLYSLVDTKDVNDANLYDMQVRQLIKSGAYTDKELDVIKKAIKWAIDNKDYNFKSILRGIDHLSNEEIYYFLNRTWKVIESE